MKTTVIYSKVDPTGKGNLKDLQVGDVASYLVDKTGHRVTGTIDKVCPRAKRFHVAPLKYKRWVTRPGKWVEFRQVLEVTRTVTRSGSADE